MFTGLLIVLLLLPGCLTIEENYTFKKDGSGSMEYVVDMSEIGELMKGLHGNEKGSKDDGLGRMDLGEVKERLGAIPGISKVSVKKEKDGFVQRLRFRFKDLSALNAAMNRIMPDSAGGEQEFFHWDGGTLVRRSNGHARGLGGDMGGDAGDTTDMTAMLQMMHYKFDFRFAEDLADTHVAEGVRTENVGARQVRFDTDWSVISKDPTALDLRIALKR
jgi:hypothetical protein